MKKLNLVGVLVLSMLFINCEKDADILVEETQEQQLQVLSAEAKIYLPENREDGYDEGYYWTVYKKGGAAQIDFPISNKYGGNFQLDYQNTKNVVGGKGWKGGKDRKIGYNVGYTYGNFEFVGVYGWTKNTDVEYYVIEKGQGGTNGSGYTYVKTYWSDGKKYNFYKRYVKNAPCALSSNNCNFWQYKSVRQGQPKYISGKTEKISMSKHASEWRKEGFGSYTQYQVFGMETYSSGYKGTAGINATVWEE